MVSPKTALLASLQSAPINQYIQINLKLAGLEIDQNSTKAVFVKENCVYHKMISMEIIDRTISGLEIYQN